MKSFAFILATLLLLATSIQAAELRGTDPRTIVVKEDDAADNRLRFLLFGTSRTWGYVFHHQSDNSFANLLLNIGPVTNLGIGGGNSDYPSLCANTMMRDQSQEAYDVIILEFPGYPSSFKNTIRLAKRLQQQYPKALLLFLDVWLMGNFKHNGVGIKTWAEEQGFDVEGRKVVDPGLLSAIQLKTRLEEWTYDANDAYGTSEREEIRKMGGVMVSMPHPNDIQQALEVFGGYYGNDFTHFTDPGNYYVYQRILEALKRFRSSHDPTLGHWDGVDDCQLWFRTGDVGDLEHNMGEVIQIKKNKRKFALEASPAGDSWIKIVNHDSGPLMLSVAYMRTSPDCLYPETNLSIVGGSSAVVKCQKMGFPWPVHVIGQIKVGMVPAGESILNIQPQGPGEWPFRVIGTVLSPEPALRILN